MNDPTQNELLSAYLDGELDATEQANVERLLAADPAARQLLDDLRALSVTLQALPQERIGEDLSGVVLRTAARRVLLEGAPGETEDATPESVPQGRSVFHRFFNARGLAWAGIAVAFAAVITIFERHQDGPAADKGAKQVALATLKPEKPAEELEGLPPASQSILDSVVESAKPPAAPAEEIVGTAEEPLAESFATKSAKRAAPPPGAPPAPSAAFRANNEMGGRSAPADKKAPADEEVLVVNCDVTPEAVARKTFEKLLAANGIARPRLLILRDLGGGGAGREYENKEKRRTDAEIAPPPESGEVNLIYVEATPEQIEATLAALAARPKDFSNVSVNPPRGAPPSRLALDRRLEARPKAGSAGTFGGAPLKDNLAESQQTPARGPDTLGEEIGQGKPDADEHDADRSRQEAKKEEKRKTRSPSQPVPRQRVLFVLRNVGGDQPPVEAARIQAAEQPEATGAKQQAAPPAKAPAKQK